MIETTHLMVLSGTPQHDAAAARCEACGVTLWTHHRQLGDQIAFVPVGILDEGERLPPDVHYFTRSKHPWVHVPPGIPTFTADGLPEKPEAVARIEAVLRR